MLLFYSVNRVIVSSVALLNVGEAEKAAQAPVKAEDGSTAESCGCNKPVTAPKPPWASLSSIQQVNHISHRYHN